MKKVIYLNAGHSLTRSGAVSRYGRESVLNRKIRDCLIPELEKYGFEVKKVPDGLNLVPSIAWVNNLAVLPSDGLALSIHINCCGGIGAECFYHSHRIRSKAIAKKMIDEYCKETRMNNRGARSDTISHWKRLGWIRNTKCEAILIECGFIDNKADVDRIKDFERTARGICKGVCKIFGVEYTKKPEPKENKKSAALDEIIKILKKYKLY